ncbi:MAG: ABC transporter substrate-binding protein [Acidimicrobiales bacterium]
MPITTTRRTSGRRAGIAVVLALLATMALASCRSTGVDQAEPAGAAATTPPTGGRLVYGVAYDVNTWSPFVERWLASGQVAAQAFYEPLATVDEDGTVVPFLAAAITPNADFTQWTIDLRDGIRFHDGAPLDAEAVALNLRTQGLGSPTNIAPLNGISEVEVTGPLQVVLRAERPFVTLPQHLTGQLGNQAGYMASPAQIGAADPDGLPVGTGPFVATAWEPGVAIEGKRNPDYWRAGLPRLDEIEFRFIPDDRERLAAVDSGELDAATFNDGAVLDLDAIADDPDLRVTAQESDLVQRFVVLNAAVAPTDDVEVRRALAMAIDRPAMVATDGRDAEASLGPIAATSEWSTLDTTPAYDPTAARAAIERWEAANGPMRLTLAAADDPGSVRRQQAVADAWTAVGVEVTVEAFPQPALPIRVANGEDHATVFEKFSGLDPDTYAMFLLGSNVNPIGTPSLNLAHLDDPAFDDIVWRTRAMAERSDRVAAYPSFEQELAATVPIIWLSESPPLVIASDRVRGIGTASLPDGGEALAFLSGRHGMAELAIDRG